MYERFSLRAYAYCPLRCKHWQWYEAEVPGKIGHLTEIIAQHARQLGCSVPPHHAPHIVGLRWTQDLYHEVGNVLNTNHILKF